jgi:hypothetical protein
LIGRILSDCTILDAPGEGGIGTFCRAEGLSLYRVAALEIVPPEVNADADRLELVEGDTRLSRQ